MLGLALVVLINAAPTIQSKARGAFLDTASITGASSLKTNDHVDVVAVFTDPETKRATSVTLLQNVIVVGTEATFFTLLVLPEEAELLAIAKMNGQLFVTLRNPTDIDVLEERKPSTLQTLLPAKPKK
jgi:hypothetical protein